VTEKLQAEEETLQAEGWKWIAVAPDFPYGHTAGLRRLTGETPALTEAETTSLGALTAEYNEISEIYLDAEELPDEVDQRLGEIDVAMAALENRTVLYDPAEIARAGIFVSIDNEGALHIERGFVRPEDEALISSVESADGEAPEADNSDRSIPRTVIAIGGAPVGSPTNPETDMPEEDDTVRSLSDRLVTELTAHRTLALRDAVARDPHVAFLAVLHALCLNAFYRYASYSCLEITSKNSGFSAQAPGLAETSSAKAIDARHEQWARALPEGAADLWSALTALDHDGQAALFAHCASLTVNVVKEPLNRRPATFAHGDQLARAVNLDMAAAGWKPAVDNYLGRVPKARILDAVRETRGAHSAQLIDHLKKPEMAKEAERLLAGTGWLPEPLRLAQIETDADAPNDEAEALPDFLTADDDSAAIADPEEPEPDAVAAE